MCVIATVVIGVVVLLTVMNRKEKIKVLILPKFEIGEMSGDDAGEAQYYYEQYCRGGKEFEFEDGLRNAVYIKNGIALYQPGMGKVNCASNLTRLLEDDRFDFSDAYIVSTGCGGGSTGTCVMGDVVIGTAVVDYDLGYKADPREMADDGRPAWFRDSDYDSFSHKLLDEDLMERLFQAAKDVKLESTDRTRSFMAHSFDNAEWACREPKVMKGTIVTSDNYWKGKYDHESAVFICNEYGCPDDFAVSEMEDVALAVVADKYGLLDRFIIIRDVVDEDTFMGGATPESLWDPENYRSVTSDESGESADIFATAMKNNFEVGKVVIETILQKGEK